MALMQKGSLRVNINYQTCLKPETKEYIEFIKIVHFTQFLADLRN